MLKLVSVLVFLLTLFPAPAPAKDSKVPPVKRLDLYVMSLCPFAQILEANLAPLLEDPVLGDRVETNLYFLASFQKDGSLRSLHGKEELLENQRQLLINKKFPKKLWTYLKCRTKSSDFKACAQEAGIDPSKIEQAVHSGEGLKLLKENVKKAINTKGASASPTVFVNGKLFEEKQKLPQLICRSHTPATEPCRRLEEMEWVWDDTPVVSSGKCEDKEGVEIGIQVIRPKKSLFDKTEFIIDSLSRTFPKLQPRYFTPENWGGKTFMRLPVYLFDKKVAESPRFFDFTKHLEPVKEGYRLKKQGGSFFLNRKQVWGQIDYIYSPINKVEFLVKLMEFIDSHYDNRINLKLHPIALTEKNDRSAQNELLEMRIRYVIRRDFPDKFIPYMKAWMKGEKKEDIKERDEEKIKKRFKELVEKIDKNRTKALAAVGLNFKELLAKVNTPETESHFLKDMVFLNNLGVNGFPLFLFNNQELVMIYKSENFEYAYENLQNVLNQRAVKPDETGHTDVVTALAVSSRGDYLVTGSKDHSLIIWDLRTGREIRRLAGHRGRITALALDEKRGFIYSAGTDHKIRVWNLDTGQMIKSFPLKWPTALALAANGNFLISGSQEKSKKNFVKVWNPDTGKLFRTLPEFHDRISSMALSPDNRYMVTGSWDDYEAKVRELGQGKIIARLPAGSEYFMSVAVSRDSKRIVTGSRDGVVMVWEPSSGKLLKKMQGKHDYAAMAVLFSKNGEIVVSAGVDGKIRFWETGTGKQIKEIDGQNDIFSLSLNLKGDQLVSGHTDSSIKIWSFPGGKLEKTLGGKKRPITSVAVGGGLFYSGDAGGWLTARDLKTQKLIIKLQAHKGELNSMVLTPDKKLIVTAGDDRFIKIWQAGTGELVRSIEGGKDKVASVSVSPDGKLIASGNWDYRIRIWELSSGKLLKTLKGHENLVTVVAFNPRNPDQVVSASWDESVRFWDVKSGKTTRTIKGDFTYIRSLAFSPDGKEIAVENFHHQIQVWRVEDGKLLTTTAGEKTGILSLCYSKNGKRIYAAYEDNSIRAWNHYSGKLLSTLTYHSFEVTSLVLDDSSDQHLLVSGSKDGEIRIWPVAPPK